MAKQFDTIRLLVLDDSAEKAEQLVNILRNAGHPVRPKQITNLPSLLKALAQGSWDLCLSRWQLNELNALDAINTIAQHEKDIPVLVVEDQVNMVRWVEALNSGAACIINTEDEKHVVLKTEQEINHLKSRRQLKKVEYAHREIEKRCELLLDSSREAIAYVHEGIFIHANSAFLNLLNYQNIDTLLQTPLMDLIASQDRLKFKETIKKSVPQSSIQNSTLHLLKSDGHIFEAELNLSTAAYDGEICTQIIIRLQNENQSLGRKIQLLSTQDLLTGLHSRQYFLQSLDDLINYAASEQKNGTVLFLEINNFNLLRSQLGVSRCDLLISDISDFLKTNLPGEIVLSRYSEDTFGALLKNTDNEQLNILANQVVEQLKAYPFEIAEQKIHVEVTAGAAIISETAPSAHELLSRAHHACSSALKQNTNFTIYQISNELSKNEVIDQEVIEIIKNNMINGQFDLRYQPIICLHGENLELYEVHLRMKNAAGEDILPDQFFPVAQRTGLLADIDRCVITQVTKIIAESRSSGIKAILFVRLSDASILDETLLSWISIALKKARVPSDALIFEIRETDASTHLKHTQALAQGLKAIHCKIALTKFGNGINSFNTLKIVDPDYVKLDNSFTAELANGNSETRAQLQNITRSIQSQGKLCIIPYVENANIIPILWQIGVNYIQGYYLQPPSDHLDYNFDGHLEEVI